MKKIFFLTFFLFIIISIIVLINIIQNKNSTELSGSLINNNLPKFEIIDLFNNNNKLSSDDFSNKILIINFFASWCAPCKEEHPVLLKLKKLYPELIIIGIDHKDINSNAINFLENLGNPYHYVGIDENGNIGLKFGVLGLPETCLTNGRGKIIYKHLGPLTEKIVKNEIVPLLH